MSQSADSSRGKPPAGARVGSRIARFLALFSVVLTFAYAALGAVPEPERWIPPPANDPSVTASSAKTYDLRTMKLLFNGQIRGPEAIALGPKGVWIYTALRDGRLIRFDEYQPVHELIAARGTGRLFSYDPSSDTLKLEADALHFANGVAVGPNDDYVLVCETLAFRIQNYWLRWAKAGSLEPWIENLPALPDNIIYDETRNLFWVAFFAARAPIIDQLLSAPIWLKRALLRIPPSLLGNGSGPSKFAWVAAFDPSGNMVASFRDDESPLPTATTALPTKDRLFVGSVTASGLGVVPLPAELAFPNRE